MPRYFFDIVDGIKVPDLEGSEHANMQGVIVEAARIAAELLEHRAVNESLEGSALVTTVVDEGGNVVFVQSSLAPVPGVYRTPSRAAASA